jgi:hypothetical protein
VLELFDVELFDAASASAEPPSANATRAARPPAVFAMVFNGDSFDRLSVHPDDHPGG